jgi:hypothetical protein
MEMGQNEHDFGAKNGSLRAKNGVRICAVSPMKLDTKKSISCKFSAKIWI